ncbi:MAG: DUF523 domain-containing protein [Candidatus Marinimicrobia bacterium]|nr:DUF523 domain-containing protein [Candidatus Neomarinimicrobiota bacterium]
MKLVSACLAGIDCAYDGKARSCEKVIELVKKGEALPVCPEQLGGLPTPRIPAEIQKGKVINQAGQDVSANYHKGAEEALKIAKMANCREAILKSNSPSCGKGIIYDGTFNHVKVQGNGVFTAMLLKEGLQVKTEKEI